jgi:hypothetical protein
VAKHAVILLAIVLVNPSIASACSCDVPTPSEALQLEDYVFSAAMRDFQVVPNGFGNGLDAHLYTAVVVDCWKGGLARGDTVLVWTYEPNIGICGTWFVLDQVSIVFGSGQSRSVSTDSCLPNSFSGGRVEAELGEPGCATTVSPASWALVKRLFQ